MGASIAPAILPPATPMVTTLELASEMMKSFLPSLKTLYASPTFSGLAPWEKTFIRGSISDRS